MSKFYDTVEPRYLHLVYLDLEISASVIQTNSVIRTNSLMYPAAWKKSLDKGVQITKVSLYQVHN